MQEFLIGMMQHDMEMLDCVDRLERLPVLKPDDLITKSAPVSRVLLNDPELLSPPITYLVSRHPRAKRLAHIVVNLLAGAWGQIVRRRVVFQLELGPYHQVDDAVFNPIRPVIEKDADVLCTRYLSAQP